MAGKAWCMLGNVSYLSIFAIILFAPRFHVKSEEGDFTEIRKMNS